MTSLLKHLLEMLINASESGFQASQRLLLAIFKKCFELETVHYANI
jgi:hypothetical protein